MATLTFNPKEQFIENLAHIIIREFSDDLWNKIKIYFQNIDFTKYDESVKKFNKKEQAREVLTNFDTSCTVLEENLDTQQLRSLFIIIEDHLDFGEKSDDETGCTNRELWYNRAILNFNLL